MTTATALISSAMKKIGVLTKSETPDADESADGLVSLNALLSSWSNESLFVYSRTTDTFNLVGGTASYTIGPSATFNTTRPIKIIEAHINDGTTSHHLDIISDEVYQAIPVKTSQGLPQFLNFTNAFPSATINLYSVPATTYTLTITSEKPLVTLALTDTLSLPAGWERALTYNLALEMAPEYGVTPDALIVATAREAKGVIAATVAKNRPMQRLQDVTRVNIYNGGF